MQIEILRQQLQEYDRLYRLGESPITDTEFDRLSQELIRLEKQSGLPIPAESPTQRVGDVVIDPTQTRVEHSVPMLSIENTFNIDELRDFEKRVKKKLGNEPTAWIVELKIDGVAASLVYENGIFMQALTRGDGRAGDDITFNFDMVIDMPRQIENKNRIEVRGEIYMLNSDLTLLNEEQQRRGEKIYKNARNLTAGTISLKDPGKAKNEKERQGILAEHQRRKLRFFAHSVGSHEGIQAKTHWDFLQELETLGIPITPYAKRFTAFDEAVGYCEAFYSSGFPVADTSTADRSTTSTSSIEQTIAERTSQLEELDFEIDGLVLKIDDFVQREQLGTTEHHPHWAIAYKVERYEALTTLRDIIVQVGKTGTITPVALLEGIELAGTTVSRASLHNAEEIERKDIRVGDVVVVEKAGKIIPRIVRVEKHLRTKKLEPYLFPTACPVCASPVAKDEGGVYIRCPNTRCPAQFKEKLRYFASRNAMDIEGLGEKLIEQLVDAGLVRSFGDLYRLEWNVLKNIDRMAEKSATNLINAIAKSKSNELPRFLNALSIRHVGNRTAMLLSRHFGSLDRLRRASEAEIAEVDEIGQIMAKSIFNFFCYEQETLDDLLDAMGEDAMCRQDIKESATANENTAQVGMISSLEVVDRSVGHKPDSIFYGKNVVFTGTMSSMTRSIARQKIETVGGIVSDSIRKDTDFLVIGQQDYRIVGESGMSNKQRKAVEMARKGSPIEILSEEEFLKIL